MAVYSPEGDLPPFVRWGRRLLLTSVGCIIVGRATVKMVPGLQGRGLDNVTLSILIPIWAIGIADILLLLMGWIRHPMLHTDLDADRLGFKERPDGKIFGRLTKSLAVLTVTLLWLGSLGLFVDAGDPNPLWAKGLLFYCISCYCGLVVYLVVLYPDPLIGHERKSIHRNRSINCCRFSAGPPPVRTTVWSFGDNW
jgi:hypothetical protein